MAQGQRQPVRGNNVQGGDRQPATAGPSSPDLTQARMADAQIRRGKGGETHQTADGGMPTLTTQQGTPVSDDQNSLRAGDRGPTLLEDFHLREKIFHFDHERIPERVVHARGYGAHGFFETYESLSDITRADIFQRVGEKTPVFVRFSTVAGNKGSAGPCARCARFCGQVLHEGRQLGSRRQQYPGFLHSGCDQVPRLRPRSKAGAGPRLPAGANGPRQFLGFHFTDARNR